jgi:hypothetical protein
MVAAAEHFVRDFSTWRNIADNDLLAFGDHYSTQSARIVSGSRTTPTERLNLESIYTICKFHQTRRSRK